MKMKLYIVSILLLCTVIAAPCILKATPTDTISYAEYFFDADPGIGMGTAISIHQGAIIDSSFSIPTTGLPDGMHRFYIRFADKNGDWDFMEGQTFDIISGLLSNSTKIIAMEYDFDSI